MFYFHRYLGKIPIVTNIFQMGWNHQLAKCWLQLLPTFNSKQTSKQTSGFNLDKSNKTEKRKRVRRTPGKLQLTSENYTFTRFLLFTPIPGKKIQVDLRILLYNFLPGLVHSTTNFWKRSPFGAEFGPVILCVFPNQQRLKESSPFYAPSLDPCISVDFAKKNRKFLDGEFCWGIFWGFFRPCDLLRKKGGQPWFSAVSEFHVLKFQFVSFFLLRGMLAGERQALVAREKSCNKQTYYSFCAVPSDEHSWAMDDYFRYLNDEQMSNKVGVDHQLAGTCLFSIFALQPSKTRPFPIKNNGHFGSGYTCVCLSKILLDVMTPFFFSEKNLPNPKRSGVSPAVLFLIILQYVSWMTKLKLHQVRGRKMVAHIFFQTGPAGWKGLSGV